MWPKLLSLTGLVVFIAAAWGLSLRRRDFPWRTVLTGLGMQMVLAFLILVTAPGKAIFEFANHVVSKLIGFSDEGARMVFGPLADAKLLGEKWGPENAFVFVLTVTATIILVSAVSSVLYHYGLLQRVVRGAAWVMQRVMRTSGSESLAAAANIFMGQTEAPLVIKPYLPGMTRSELMALMTGGMATIAGGVLAVYIKFGESVGRMDMAGHLLTASVMSAPAALMIAKIILPETEQSQTAAGASADVNRDSVNGLDAMCRGASEGMMLALNVMAMLIAFVAIVAAVNYMLQAGLESMGVTLEKPLQTVLGWLNWPFAFLMGVPVKDCHLIGQILGERIVLNEFVGYLSLSQQQAALDVRSFTIATYALCGFANFSSIAIQIGGIGVLAPSRRPELASLGLRAMAGGVLASYLAATIAGLLI